MATFTLADVFVFLSVNKKYFQSFFSSNILKNFYFYRPERINIFAR